MIEALIEIYPHIPICLHQDHGNNEATCLTAIQHGFTSVMMDGSLEADAKTPASYDYNVDITVRVVADGACRRRLGRRRTGRARLARTWHAVNRRTAMAPKASRAAISC